jgi:hypothetical protein
MKITELRALIREQVKAVLKEATVDTINFTNAIKYWKSMKRYDFEDDDSQEDFINEIAAIAKQLGIKEDVTNDDIIAGFLENVQDDELSGNEMVEYLKDFLTDLK